MNKMRTSAPINGADLPNFVTPMIVLGLALLGIGWLTYQSDAKLMLDWLGREGSAIFLWWLLTTLAGAAALPLLFRLLPGLPSRGYALARPAGVMLVGFVFWFAASLGLWANTPGAIALAWLLVIVFAAFIWRRSEDRPDMGAWLRENGAFVLTVEILFAALLIGWAIYRAHEPEVRSTEKPMEMMFFNSIRQSEFFPPNDGWLAGYSISYYYFGYVIMAGMADLSGVNGGIAFGLTAALLFALSGIGIFGVVYDLVRAAKGGRSGGMVTGLLGVILLLFAGNLGTFFIEMPWNGSGLIGHNYSLPDFTRIKEFDPLKGEIPESKHSILSSLGSLSYFEFWAVPERSRLALDLTPDTVDEKWEIVKTGDILSDIHPDVTYGVVRDLNNNLIPDWDETQRPFTRWDYWWWFRYSRVIGDNYLNGDPIGVLPIAEVPQFSFILSDMHPHVLALPFGVLAIGLAAGLVLSGRELEWWGYALLAIWVGGMIFMNSWDAIYIPFLVGAEALRRLYKGHGLSRDDWIKVFGFATIILVLTVIFYAPWIFSFTSQAGGVYLNIIWNTAPQQLFLQFGGFFLLLIPFIMLEMWRGRGSVNWVKLVGVFFVLFLAIVVILPFGAANLYHQLCTNGGAGSGLREAACNAQNILFGGVSPDTDSDFWHDLLVRRFPSWLSEGLMLLVIAFAGFRLFGRRQTEDEESPQMSYSASTGVALLVLAAGLALILLPDFAYLVDNFRVRINTVFKLYYQGWIFLSIAAAFGVYGLVAALWERIEKRSSGWAVVWLVSYAVLIIAVLGMTLMYPYYGIRARGWNETGFSQVKNTREACQKFNEIADDDEQQPCADLPTLSLDGRSQSFREDELQVALCLEGLNPPPDAVVAEAPYNGGYNADYGRVATLTGVPNLLGWINHEGQWRGPKYDQVTEVQRDANGAVISSREIEADKLYKTTDWVEAQAVINRYGINYVMVGEAERIRYEKDPDGLEKFGQRFTPVCQAGSAALYEVGG